MSVPAVSECEKNFGCFTGHRNVSMALVRITSWYPNFNGNHFGLPPSERSTEWLDCHRKSCELWRIRTGAIVAYDTYYSVKSARGFVESNQELLPWLKRLFRHHALPLRSLRLVWENQTCNNGVVVVWRPSTHPTSLCQPTHSIDGGRHFSSRGCSDKENDQQSLEKDWAFWPCSQMYGRICPSKV